MLLPVQTPVAIESVPATGAPPLVEAPKAKLPPVPVAQEQPKPQKAKKRTKPSPPTQTAAGSGTAPATATTPDKGVGTPTAPTGTETAAAAPAATPAPAGDVGVFSVGGEQNPHSKTDAESLIVSNERRLSGLGADAMRTQAALVSKIRTFQRDAEQALGSGDAEGAKTLATKGKLLLDDLERGVPSQ